MLKNPRMTAWCLLSYLCMLLSRLLFFPAPALPYYLDFNPGIVLVPLTAVFWGPAGVWGCALAGLTVDLLAGFGPAWSFFRLIGLFLMGLTTMKLWDAYPWAKIGRAGHADRWGTGLRFILVSWVGCAVCAAWSGIGSEGLRTYPFAYITGLVLFHHLLFVALLGVVSYRFAARRLGPNFETWREMPAYGLDRLPRLSLTALSLLTGGAVGACVAGLLISGAAYRVRPFQPYVLGTVTGPLVFVAVVPFLLCHLVGLFPRSQRVFNRKKKGL